MRRSSLAGALPGVLVLLLGLPACASFEASSEGSTGSEAGAPSHASPALDGGTSDAAGDAASDGGSVPGGSNLFVNGGFESGCAGWEGSQATLQTSSDAHSGTASCKVCTKGASYPQLRQYVDVSTVKGRRYDVELFVRAPPGTTPGSVKLGLFNYGAGEKQLDFEGYEESQPPSATWERLHVELVASADGTSLRMLLPLSGVVGDCILVDDAALYEPK